MISFVLHQSIYCLFFKSIPRPWENSHANNHSHIYGDFLMLVSFKKNFTIILSETEAIYVAVILGNKALQKTIHLGFGVL